MELCICKYSFYHIEGMSQVLPKSTAILNSKKIFQRFLSTVQPSNSSSSEGEEVVDSNRNLSEKLQTSWTNVTKLKSAAMLNGTNVLQKNKWFLNQQKRKPIISPIFMEL